MKEQEELDAFFKEYQKNDFLDEEYQLDLEILKDELEKEKNSKMLINK